MRIKKIGSICLAMLLSVSLAGCNKSGVETVVTEGEDKINAGWYLANLLEQQSLLIQKTGVKESEVLTAKYEDKTGEQWIKDEALKRSKFSVMIEKEFKEKQLSFNEEEKLQSKNQKESYWTYLQDYYVKNGVGEESLGKFIDNDIKKTKLFHGVYGEQGTQKVSQEALKKFDQEHFAKVQYIQFPIVTEKNKKISSEEIEKMMKLINELKDKVGAGEDFKTISTEYSKQIKEQTKEKLDPNIATTVQDYFVNKKEPTPVFTQDLIGQVFSKKSNESGVYQGEKSIIVYKKVDKTEEDFKNQKTNILNTMKFDIFEEELFQKYTGLKFDINEEATSYYSPKKIKS